MIGSDYLNQLDPTDLKILLAMIRDPRILIGELSESLGIARNTAQTRVRRLLRAGVLRPGGRFVFSVTHPTRWAFPDDPGPGGLTLVQSYFDRTPYVEVDETGAATYVEHAPRGYSQYRRSAARWLGGRMHVRRELDRELGPGFGGRYGFTRHHQAHAASAFYPSPFEEAATLTLDAPEREIGKPAFAVLSEGVSGAAAPADLQVELGGDAVFLNSQEKGAGHAGIGLLVALLVLVVVFGTAVAAVHAGVEVAECRI